MSATNRSCRVWSDHAAIAVENASFYRVGRVHGPSRQRAGGIRARTRRRADAGSRSWPGSLASRAPHWARMDSACSWPTRPHGGSISRTPKAIGSGIINWTPNRFWSMAVGEVTASGVPLYVADAECLYHTLNPRRPLAYRAAHMQSIAFLAAPERRRSTGRARPALLTGGTASMTPNARCSRISRRR